MYRHPQRCSRPAFLGCLAAALLLLVGARPPACPAQEKAAGKTPTVELTVDFGDGFQKRFTQLKWHNGMTVIRAMEQASQHPRGIEFKHRGKGATAFLFQIDDLANERIGRAWLYRVNGKRADRSIAVYPLKAGDTILWEFDKY